MAYIGNIPAEKYISITSQTFTTVNGTGYVLSSSVTNSEDIALFLNNVRQKPSTYTASGTALTMGTATTTADELYCVYLGKALQTVTPPASSVTTAMIVDDAVTTAKILDDNVTTAKILDDNVTTAKILDDNVTTDKILDANVTTAKTDLVSTASVAAVTAKGTSGVSDGYITLNCDQNTHGIKLKSPPHSAAQSYTLTFPITAPATDKYLQTTSGGQLSFATVTEYDDDALQNDIATLALHQATNANAAKYNLTNTNVDVFQDSTGIASLTDCVRDETGEYISTSEPASYGTLTNFVANNWDIGALTPFTVGDGTAVHAASPDQSALIVTNASATTPLTFDASKPFQVTATNAATTHGAFLAFYKPSEEPSGSPAENSDWTVAGLGKTTDGFTMQMGTVYGQVSWGNGTTQTNFVSGNSDFDFNGTQFTIARDELGVFRIYQGTRSGTLILTSTSTGGQDFSYSGEYAFAWGGSGSFASSASSFQYTVREVQTHLMQQEILFQQQPQPMLL